MTGYNDIVITWTVSFLFFMDNLTSGMKISRIQTPIDCFQANTMCHRDGTCKRLLGHLFDVCDKGAYFCLKGQTNKPTLNNCGSILLKLQTNTFFHNCTCNPDNEHRSTHTCQQVQGKIHDHPCTGVKKGRYRSSTYHYTVNMAPAGDDSHYDDDYDADADQQDLEDMDDGEGGCIRARKECIDNSVCDTALRNYRIKCKESKKQNRCNAVDREGCFHAITTLRSLSAAIFQCQCHQRNHLSLTRCRRIRFRLANNTCLVDVPYFIHSKQPKETSYDTLVSIVQQSNTGHLTSVTDNSLQERSTCQQAFKDCNTDSNCKNYLSQFINACAWSQNTYSCDRAGCLQAIKDFFVYISSRRTQSLLFCQCKNDDGNCHALRRALYPTCSLVEAPAPSCLSIMERCKKEGDCSLRYEAYERKCGFGRGVTLCPGGPANCRSAIVGIMGTILTTNCTCILSDHSENKQCMEIRWKLQGQSSCKKDAIEHFQLGYDGVEPRLVPVMDGQPARKEGSDHHHLYYNYTKTLSPRPILVVNTKVSPNQYSDCLGYINSKYNIPNYYPTPETIRVFSNVSECSELCRCLYNGTLECTKLPCMTGLSCKVNDVTYVHGTSFNHNYRGQCRCIKSEMVCALAIPSGHLKPPGLFLHVGFSISDKNLIEEHSTVKFNDKNIARKLGTILNGDSHEQVCTLTLHSSDVSNIVLRIELSNYNFNIDRMEGCVSAAKQLCYMVNSRHPVIVTDAELSIIKVAQLENISIHTNNDHQNIPNHKSAYDVNYETLLSPTGNEEDRYSSDDFDAFGLSKNRDPTVSSQKVGNKCSKLNSNKLCVYIFLLITLLTGLTT